MVSESTETRHNLREPPKDDISKISIHYRLKLLCTVGNVLTWAFKNDMCKTFFAIEISKLCSNKHMPKKFHFHDLKC